MKVYRLEDIDGLGPYGTHDLYSRLEHNDNLDIWPSAPNDVIGWNWDMVCGCTSLKTLLSWFPKSFIQLARKSRYKIMCYEVDGRYVHKSISKKQVGFYAFSAKKKYEVKI